MTIILLRLIEAAIAVQFLADPRYLARRRRPER
jgi:hypothetical protein